MQKALHVRALRPFKDGGGRERRTGEEWLVTMADTEAHIPSVAEEVVGVVEVTTLSSRQYCVVLDPVGADGKPQLGQKKVVKVRSCFPAGDDVELQPALQAPPQTDLLFLSLPAGGALVFPAAWRAS